MDVLVIVTVDGSSEDTDKQLWKKIKNRFKLTENAKSHKIDIDNDKIVIIFKAPNENITNDIDENLKKINNISNLYIATHDELEMSFFYITFSHISGEEDYDIIKALVQSLCDNSQDGANKYFNKLCDFIKKKAPEQLRSHILHLFLPLDIDMQALPLPENKQFNYLQKMVKETNELITKEGRKKDFYSAKLTEANQLLEQISDTKKKEDIEKHLRSGYITDFVNRLDCLLNDENDESNLKEIIKQTVAFHVWYTELSKDLKGFIQT